MSGIATGGIIFALLMVLLMVRVPIGIAMFTMFSPGVGAIDRCVTLGRQKICLWYLWPMREVLRFAAMDFANLLETHNVGIELLHGVSKIVDLKAANGTNSLHALMNVVGCDPQDRHATAPRCSAVNPNRESCNIASALEGEKHRSAACR